MESCSQHRGFPWQNQHPLKTARGLYTPYQYHDMAGLQGQKCHKVSDLTALSRTPAPSRPQMLYVVDKIVPTLSTEQLRQSIPITGVNSMILTHTNPFYWCCFCVVCANINYEWTWVFIRGRIWLYRFPDMPFTAISLSFPEWLMVG